MNLPTLMELLQAGVHFGHQKGRWHPKMKPFIFAERNGVHIIDLEQTLAKLKEAAEFAEKIGANGGNILFVGTKSQAKPLIEKYAKQAGMPYIKERWVGGLFTNFVNVGKLIKKYRSLKEQRDSGALAKYTKKEQVMISKEIERLDKMVGGLESLNRLPDAVFVLDAKREKTAVLEAKKRKIPIIGPCDTNINPDLFTYPIPANDDALNSVDLITRVIAEAINFGKVKQKKETV
ncbi:MAG: 30S ribosomal protein S2 [Patescibacteria group bacterium]|jgi:small subunit ribosomal protein S2